MNIKNGQRASLDRSAIVTALSTASVLSITGIFKEHR